MNSMSTVAMETEHSNFKKSPNLGRFPNKGPHRRGLKTCVIIELAKFHYIQPKVIITFTVLSETFVVPMHRIKNIANRS